MPSQRERSITFFLVFGYRLALLFLAALSVVSFIILEENIRSQKGSAEIVNYSGRQRMLSQRIALFSLRMASEKDSNAQDNLRKELKSVIELMEKTHQGLIGGDSSMSLASSRFPEVSALYFFAPVSLDEQVRVYLSHAKALLSVSTDALNPQSPDLQYILAVSADKLIRSLDSAVAQYQRESEAKVLRLEVLQFIVLIVSILVLFTTGIFIFHPLTRRIRIKSGQLERQAAELSVSNERLHQEINERAALSKRLAEVNELNDTLIKTIPFGIDIVDEDGNILYLNERMVKIFSEEAIGDKCYHLYKDNKQQCERCPLRSGIQLGQTRATEVGGVMGARTFLISHTGMFYQDKKAILEIFEDITDYKDTQEKLAISERLATIGRMAGVIAHEFRNQLSVMRNVVYFLKMKIEDKNEKVVRHLQILDEQIADTERIIENILSFAKAKQPELQKTDLEDLLLASIDKVKIPEGIKLDSQIDELPLLYADPLQLGGVFVNIIINAIQAMEEKGRLQIRLAKENNYAILIFKDTGKGIKKEDKARIFEPFFSTKPRGTGLGLATAKILIEGHGGSIDIKSDYGEGTAVIVRIPVKPVRIE